MLKKRTGLAKHELRSKIFEMPLFSEIVLFKTRKRKKYLHSVASVTPIPSTPCLTTSFTH